MGDFVKAVKAHAKLRCTKVDGELDEEKYAKMTYWVCAYANNQHELGTDIDKDPRKTSFYRAMSHCIGVLLILDANATPFTRAWCCFEEAMVVRDDQRKGKPPLPPGRSAGW